MPKPRFAATLLVFALLLAPGATLAQPGIATHNDSWTNTCVECPKLVRSMSPHCLRLDAQGQPHIVYGGDDLYYAFYDGAAWRVEVVDQDVDVYQTSTALALAADQPWIAYARHFDLMLAFKDGAGWRYEVVEDAGSVSGSIELAINSQGQPRIGYFNGGRLRYAVRTSQGWQLHDVEPAGLAACCSAGFVLGPGDTPFFTITDADSKDYLLVTTAAGTERIWLPLVLKGRVQ